MASKFKIVLLSLLLLLPFATHATITDPWIATSTDPGYIQPDPINGFNPFLKVLSLATSTFQNGINLTSGCFSIGGVCITGGGSSTGLATTSPWVTGQLAQVFSNGAVNSIATSSLGLLTTNVAEGTNQYFTNARATANFISNLAATTSVSSITTLSSLSLPFTQLTGVPAFDTFGYPFPSNATSTLLSFTGGANISNTLTLSGITGSTQCLSVDSSGHVSGTGSACGSGSGSITNVTGTYPIQTSGSSVINVSTAFGTTTGNTFGATQTFTNSPVFSTLTAGTVNSTAGGTLYQTATSSVTNGTGISFSGTPGALVGGTSLTITNSSPLSGLITSFPFSFTGGNTLSWLGLSTSSALTSGQPIYATGANTLASVASSTFLTSIGGQVSGNYITALTGDISASGPGSAAATLATVNSNVGTFTYPSVTVNGKGLVTAISNGTAPATLITAGSGISTSTSAGGSILVTNTGVTSLTAGTNITLSGSTGAVTISATSGGSSFAYPFPSNATSTLLSFNGGINVGPLATYQLNNSTVITGSTTLDDYFFGPSGSSGYTGTDNTGFGAGALSSLTTGSRDTAIGRQAIDGNTSGSDTTAVGFFAGNIGVGEYDDDTFIGSYTNENAGSVFASTTELGYKAGYNNAGNGNTFLGYQSAYDLTSGAENIAIGQDVDEPSNTASGQLNIGNLIYGTGIYTGGTPSASPSGGNIGIGTTTPGSIFSIGNTSGINFSLGTSTFSTTGGINITSGCYAVNGTCIGSGGGGTVTGVTATYPILSSGGTAPVISTAFGTTTTNTYSALNTFNGGLTIGSLTGTLNVNGGVVYSTATSTPTLGSGLSYGGTLGSFVGGSSGSLSVAGLTTGNFTSANVSQWTNDAGYLTSSGAVTSVKQSFGTAQVGAITLATTTDSFNGLNLNEIITNSGGTFTFANSVTGTLNNAGLTNSTISGIALGGTLDTLSATNATLTFSGSYTGAANQTVGINLSNPNTWTGLQQFSNATSTLLTVTTEWLPSLGTSAGAFLAVDPTGKIIATTTPSGGGAVSSVTNSDGTLTISPTTGSVVASIALGHANTWTGVQKINPSAGATMFYVGTTTAPWAPTSGVANSVFMAPNGNILSETLNNALSDTAIYAGSNGESGGGTDNQSESIYAFGQGIGTGISGGVNNYSVLAEERGSTSGTPSIINAAVYAEQDSPFTSVYQNYGIYSSGGDNYFGGNTGFGTTSPFARLSISTTSTNAFAISDAFNTTDLLFQTSSTTGSIFTVAATTSPNLGAGIIKLFDVDQYGGITASSTGATPTIACTPTGGTLSTGSNDQSGSITSGSLSTSCTLTFAHTKLSAPIVEVSGSNTTNFVAVTAESTTAFSVSMAASSADVINYFVVQP